MSTISAPTKCPVCNTDLVLSKTGIDLFCPNNEKCPAQVVQRLSYFCNRDIGNIVGLSDKQIARFVEELDVNDILDLFTLDFEKIEQWEGFGKRSVENLKESIAKLVENGLDDYKLLQALSIEGVGAKTGQLICQSMNYISK
jgi:DNA ligase (NAD+)